MKAIHKILILVCIIILIFSSIVRINNKNIIKSVRSENELLEFYYNRGETNLNIVERVLTLPFSLFFEDSYHYKSVDYINETIDTNSYYSSSGDIASPSINKDYSKTNIQVEGVDEADIIKTDGNYIYSISENNIIISNVKDPNNVFIESKIFLSSTIPNDLLLYEKYLVLFLYSNKNNRWDNQNTLVEVYDISDKGNPIKVKSFELYAPYYTSRCIDGDLYVFSNGYLRKENDKVVRKYKEDYDTKEIPLKDIKYIKENKSNNQTLIAHLDLNDLDKLSVQSYLIDISNAYISKNNIYLTDYTYSDHISLYKVFTLKGVIGFITSVIDEYDYDSKTQIYKFEINKNKGISFNATTTVKGSVLNQYSFDEKDNHLRVALETDDGTRIAILNEKLKLIGETSKVAEGERMYASRFMGDKAYLVTYRNTDPLFVIDLSDERNPKVLGELKIPGYSTYLHPYDENHLIGIGMDTEEIVYRDDYGKVTGSWVKTNGMKMSLFDVSDINNPKELAKTTIGDSMTVSAILTNPKALLFSKEKKLLAIPVNNYNESIEIEYSEDYSEQINNFGEYANDYVSEGYFVYNLDLSNGFELKGIINHDKKYNNNYYYYNNSKLLRGVYIDNYLYTVSEGYIKVNNLEDLAEISSLAIE